MSVYKLLQFKKSGVILTIDKILKEIVGGGSGVKVTRADVAKLAGVSAATVSCVLNSSRNMSAKTRKLVLDAVDQPNYNTACISRFEN